MTIPPVSSRWRKATRSQNEGACVELHPVGAVRDSKNPAGAALAVDLGGLLNAVKRESLSR